MGTKPELNYVVTAFKPTSVTHSCFGNFTGIEDRNLIIAKCTRLEIHLLRPDPKKGLQLQCIFDEPLYGRIATLQLFRPSDAARDYLFIATEKYQISILTWDADPDNPGPITLSTMDLFDTTKPVPKADNGQIGIIDPHCRCIGLHLNDGLLKVIPLEENGLLQEAFDIRLEELDVLDIKFLYGCPQPTLVVLYQDDQYLRHVKTHVIDFVAQDFVQGPWSKNRLVVNGADSLIPVPQPLCGVLIIGEETIVYCSAANGFICPPISHPSITKAYGRVDPDGSQYLLGDCTGLLSRLAITHEQDIVTGLKVEPLGQTPIASTISYLDDEFVYVGSSYGDSQLIKLKRHPDEEGSYVEVLESYVNLGPIVDFCVAGFGRPCQGQVVTCSGADKDCSLRAVYNALSINELASEVELRGIKGMWSLRSSTDAAFDDFLVVSFVSETRIFAMNNENVLEETQIHGFQSQVQTSFCHDAVHNQLVQVTSNSVRLVSSTTRLLLNEWHLPCDDEVNVATANATQVLLATGGRRLYCLEIGDCTLQEVGCAQLEYDISCLDINPIAGDPHQSSLAAVGMWTAISVRIFSLPGLQLMREERLGGEIIPRSVLLCEFDQISYLLCALGDGHLLNFLLNTSTGELIDRKMVSLGTQPTTLRTFSSKNMTRVFGASDRPTVIYSKNGRVVYSNVNLKEVTHMCPFNSSAFPESLAIVKEDKLTICTIDDIPKLHVRSIPPGQHAQSVCHQEETRTFAICSFEYNQARAENHFVRLLDDQTFDFISEYALNSHEYGCCIISCSFSDDNDVYYCVGTACVLPEENEPTKGRILVFSAGKGKLQLITQKETKGAVNCLNAFNGKLLVAAANKIQLYEWEDFSLKYKCGCYGHTLPLHVRTRGDFIVVGELMKSISLFIYKHGEDAIEEISRDWNANWMTAVEILDDETYLGAENSFNLFTVSRDLGAENDFKLLTVGEYHIGELVKRFRGFRVGEIPTVIFGTMNGVIGVIASLTQEQYDFLEKLQSSLRNVITSIGGLSHKKWRAFNNEYKTTIEARNFLDGDLIELFLDLIQNQMIQISNEMDVSVEELTGRVKKLTRLSSLEAFES